MDLIQISGKVATALGRDEGLTAIIGDRFFPVVARDGVEGYPFLTYRNLGATHDYDHKDAYNHLRGRIEIEVAAESYESVTSTSGEVQRAMESYTDDIEFRLANYEEEFDYNLGVFISVLTFDYDEE